MEVHRWQSRPWRCVGLGNVLPERSVEVLCCYRMGKNDAAEPAVEVLRRFPGSARKFPVYVGDDLDSSNEDGDEQELSKL